MATYYDPLTEKGRLIIPDWDIATPGKLDLAAVHIEMDNLSSWHRSWVGSFKLDRWLPDWNKDMWIIVENGPPERRQRFTGRIQIIEAGGSGQFEVMSYGFYGVRQPTIEPITGEWFRIS